MCAWIRQNDEVESSRSRPRDVVLLGSTGSVGTQAADVIRRNPGRFRVAGLAAGGSNPGLLAAQAIEFGAAVVAVERESAAAEVREALKVHAAQAGRAGRTGQVPGPLTGQRLAPPAPHGPLAPHGASPAAGGGTSGPAQPAGGPLSGYGPVSGGLGSWPAAPEVRPGADGRVPLPTVLAGPDAVAEVAAWPADVVLNAVTGFSGLAATLAALRAGRVLALANKESLIVGGPLVAGLAAPGQIVPVDSEHSAIAQCLRSGTGSEVARLVLTASGGPFRGRSRAELDGITPQQALAHPTWNMGPVITINSATLVNKGLEVIEAHLLFGLGFDKIKVVVHPQSVIHSMVEFTDGSTIAQASPPDMRIPIALALGWPDRVPGAAPAIDWSTAHTWTFEPLDESAFPAVAIARQAGQAGGTSPAAYNAANEVCVDAFMAGRLPFAAIVDTVAQVVSEHDGRAKDAVSLADVRAADRWARARAAELAAAWGQRTHHAVGTALKRGETAG
jgi:1-deoxy-D-xylulose-5-phosphate reductoisomerase